MGGYGCCLSVWWLREPGSCLRSSTIAGSLVPNDVAGGAVPERTHVGTIARATSGMSGHSTEATPSLAAMDTKKAWDDFVAGMYALVLKETAGA